MAEGPNEDPDKKIPWEETATATQQFFYEAFGDRDWDHYNESEMELLERNVGHAIFGPPEELPEEKNGSTGTELLIECVCFFFFIFPLVHLIVFFCITNKRCTPSNMVL